MSFVPKIVLIQQEALKYPLGEELKERFNESGIETIVYKNRIPRMFLDTFEKNFYMAKDIFVVGVWAGSKFQPCRPSADYQLPLLTGCPGMCEYCYLHTNLGRRPYIKVNVNVDDIFDRMKKYVWERLPEETSFEGSATSDPLASESWTGLLSRTIKVIATLDKARFRFVTKFSSVESLLDIEHNGKTEIRFSINCRYVLKFERRVPGLFKRLEAAKKVISAGYPIGFLIAPVMYFEGWKEEYDEMFTVLKKYIPGDIPVKFELITHRYTSRAQKNIQEIYPETKIPFEQNKRKFKFGQFGYGKYVYVDDIMTELKKYFEMKIYRAFPRASVVYFV
ncbi:MAG: spore photoproduct lyase [Bacillota bacterium]